MKFFFTHNEQCKKKYQLDMYTTDRIVYSSIQQYITMKLNADWWSHRSCIYEIGDDGVFVISLPFFSQIWKKIQILRMLTDWDNWMGHY